MVFEGQSVRGQHFWPGKVSRFIAQASEFEHVAFERLSTGDCCFGAGPTVTYYRNCTFLDSMLRITSAGVARFENCRFLKTRLIGMRSHHCEFVSCTFDGTIENSYFCATAPDSEPSSDRINAFIDNDLSGAELIDVGFRRGIDLSRQRFPADPDYLILQHGDTAFREAWKVVVSWSDLTARASAIAALRAIEFELSAGQEQLYLRRSEFVGRDPLALQPVLELLVLGGGSAGG